MPSDPEQSPRPHRQFSTGVRTSLSWSEEAVYIIVGLLLVSAAIFFVIGTITGLVHSVSSRESAIDIGVLLLDRILLILIVAELLHTLRFVVLRGEIVVEPFLFVGLIAVVRRVLIITAELERQIPSGRALTNVLLQLGLLGVLALALAVSIYLVRRSSAWIERAPGSLEAPAPRTPPLDAVIAGVDDRVEAEAE